MVEENAAPDPGRRMHVRLERLRGPALQVERKVLPAPLPEPVSQAVRLKGVKALEVQTGSSTRVQAGSRSLTATISARKPSPIVGILFGRLQ